METNIYQTGRKLNTQRVTVVTSKTEGPSIGSSLDVDQVHAAIRSAESGNTEVLFTIYRDMVLGDSHIQAELFKRKLAVLGDNLVVQAYDKTSADDEAAARQVERLLENNLTFLHGCSQLLDATLYPVALVEKVFRISSRKGLRYEIDSLVPVPARLLDYRDGTLRIYRTTSDGRPTFESDLPDPDRYITHRSHLLMFPDNFGGPMRSLLFWWLLSVMDRSWWARFLDRYGAPFIVAKYPAGDDDTRLLLESALAWSTKIGGLVVSDGTTVELKEALSSAGDAYEKFLNVCRREMSRLILGQTLSAEAQSTGLGSGVSRQHEQVRQDIRNFDALMLGHTIRTQLVMPLMAANGIRGEAPLILWPGDTSEATERLGELMKSLYIAGLEVDDAGLQTVSEQIGLGLRRRPATNQFSPEFSKYLSASGPTAIDAADQAARGASATLSRALRERHAKYADIIRSSASPDEALDRVRAYFADLNHEDVSELITRTLRVYAVNSALVTATG